MNGKERLLSINFYRAGKSLDQGPDITIEQYNKIQIKISRYVKCIEKIMLKIVGTKAG